MYINSAKIISSTWALQQFQSGPEFRMASNHSVTVRGNEWFDHAAEKGGGPVSFLKEFYRMNY